MRVLTTDDLRKMLEVNKDIKYFGLYPDEMSDEEVIETFGKVLMQAFLHSNSKHYYSILDEPRF